MEKELEEIMRRIEENATRIEDNLEKIQKNSYALEILGDYKQESIRLYEMNKEYSHLAKVLITLIIVLVAVLCIVIFVR